DRERAEADRERLPERDHAAYDGQPPHPAPRHRRVDLVDHLRDRTVGLADRDRPARRRAHHHPLEDGLAPDVAHRELAAVRCGALELALEALDAATGIDQLLLAGVEGMASRADLDVQL